MHIRTVAAVILVAMTSLTANAERLAAKPSVATQQNERLPEKDLFNEELTLPASIGSDADFLTAIAWVDRQYRSACTHDELNAAIRSFADTFRTVTKTVATFSEQEFEVGTIEYQSWRAWAPSDAPHTCETGVLGPCAGCAAEVRGWLDSNQSGRLVLSALQHGPADVGGEAARVVESLIEEAPHGTWNGSPTAIAAVVAYMCRSDLDPRYIRELVACAGASLEWDGYVQFRDLLLHELFLVTLRECLRSGYQVGGVEYPWSDLVIAAKTSTTPTSSFAPLALGLQAATADRSEHERSLVWYALQELVGHAPLSRAQQRSSIQLQALGPNWNPAASDEHGFFRLACPRTEGDSPEQHLQRIRDAARGCNETASRIYYDQEIRREFSTELEILASRVHRLEHDVQALKERITSLEKRMAAVEADIGRLWDAIRETNEFIVEYTNLRRDQRQYRPTPLTKDDISEDEQNTLLRHLAPVLRTDNPCNHSRFAPKGSCSTCGETIVSAKWMVENCGLLRPPFTPQTPIFPFDFENRCDEAPGEYFVNGVRPPQQLDDYIKSATSNDTVNMCQGSSLRNGPDGSKFTSLTGAIARGEGVYGLVQRVGTTMYSVQYYVLFTYNSARVEEIDIPFFYKRFHHGGDWLCIDLTVRILGRDVERPLIVLAYMHNHGPVIEVSPSALETDGTHPVVYLEYGSNEPHPRAGGAGDRHTSVPGIRRNHRIKNVGWGRINEIIERVAIRRHLGRGPEYQTEHAVKNLANEKDPECSFIINFGGDWGIDGDGPQSPWFNPKMRTRGFEFSK